MKLALSMEGELEDRMEAPDWYSSLTGEAKTEADSLLAQMGKVSVLVYGRYSQYDERMENFVNEYLKQKKPGIRAGGYLLYGAAGERTLFGVSLRFKDDQETEPDSCVYYDAVLNVKNCDALQFDRKIRDDGSLVVWHITSCTGCSKAWWNS